MESQARLIAKPVTTVVYDSFVYHFIALLELIKYGAVKLNTSAEEL